jgi:hypothetical protein
MRQSDTADKAMGRTHRLPPHAQTIEDHMENMKTMKKMENLDGEAGQGRRPAGLGGRVPLCIIVFPLFIS